jgi:hypothetical protein
LGVPYFYLCEAFGWRLMRFVFRDLLVVVVFRASFLSVIVCGCFLFSVIYSAAICGYVIFLCSSLHCGIAVFLTILPLPLGLTLLYQVLCLWLLPVTQRTSHLIYINFNTDYKCIFASENKHFLLGEAVTLKGTRGSVVGWSTMLQAGTLRFRFPMRSLHFSIDLTIPVAIWPWGRLSL